MKVDETQPMRQRQRPSVRREFYQLARCGRTATTRGARAALDGLSDAPVKLRRCTCSAAGVTTSDFALRWTTDAEDQRVWPGRRMTVQQHTADALHSTLRSEIVHTDAEDDAPDECERV